MTVHTGFEEGEMSPAPSIEYRHTRWPVEEMRRRGEAFRQTMSTRRSLRQFSPEPVPRDLVDAAIRTAASAPSGANRQPWRFVVVGDPGLKRRIREAAEEEERRNYEGGRFPERWLRVLEPLGTDWHKPYLEIAPWLVVCFREDYRVLPDGRHESNYYVMESVGLACGLFIAAIHVAGLVTLPHTPSPMGFLAEILRRPRNEKPYILFPVGYPAAGARVPDIERKPLAEVVQDDDGVACDEAGDAQV
jgi:nitroreductase